MDAHLRGLGSGAPLPLHCLYSAIAAQTYLDGDARHRHRPNTDAGISLLTQNSSFLRLAHHKPWKVLCCRKRRLDVCMHSVESRGSLATGENANEKSEDEKVRARSMPLQCNQGRRVLRRGMSRRGEQRCGNCVSMRPSGMPAHRSTLCASHC